MADPKHKDSSPHESGVRFVAIEAGQLAAKKQASRGSDYESIGDGRARPDDVRRKNAFLRPEQCREKIDWGAGKLRL